jgi:hypothetical protein
LRRSVTHYRPGEILRGKDLAALRVKSIRLYADLRDALGKFDRDVPDFAGVFDAMTGFLRRAGDTYGYVNAIPEGSLTALPRLGMFYGSRVRDPALQRRLFEMLLSEFGRALDFMERGAEELLGRLAERITETERSVAPVA